MTLSNLLTAATFLAVFFGIFGFNLLISDVLERSRKRRLKELEADYKKMDIKDFTDYSKLCVYPSDMIWPISYRVVASKKDKEGKVHTDDIKIYPVQKNEVPDMRDNTHLMPSFNWRTSTYAKAGEGIELLTNNEFDLDKVEISYYKKHPLIACPELSPQGYYIGQDGKEVKDNQNLLLSTQGVDDMLVQLVGLYISGDVNDLATFNTKKDEILNGLNYVKIKFL